MTVAFFPGSFFIAFIEFLQGFILAPVMHDKPPLYSVHRTRRILIDYITTHLNHILDTMFLPIHLLAILLKSLSGFPLKSADRSPNSLAVLYSFLLIHNHRF